MNNQKEIKERGAAEIHITLKDGVITVTRVEGHVLAEWTGQGNDWDKIWETIYELESIAKSKEG